jgi:Uma2 family endonuclease
MRPAYAAWVARSRLPKFTGAGDGALVPLCPEFVVELTNFASDRLREVRSKMEEYVANGCPQAGFSIRPSAKFTSIATRESRSLAA